MPVSGGGAVGDVHGGTLRETYESESDSVGRWRVAHGNPREQAHERVEAPTDPVATATHRIGQEDFEVARTSRMV